MVSLQASPLLLIILSGLVISAISLVGASTFFLSDFYLKKALKPLVALSAGSLLGAAFFHLIPESVETFENSILTYVLIVSGFLSFFVLEQFLFWHHCHGAPGEHHHGKVLRVMVMVSDSVHNLVGGLAVGAGFMVSPQMGFITWIGEALHEIPQELGDFGVLIHSGWSRKKALLFNFLSGLAFLLGGILAYYLSRFIRIDYFIPFSAGHFIYLSTVDLVPEINRQNHLAKTLLHFASFVTGLCVLFLIKVMMEHD